MDSVEKPDVEKLVKENLNGDGSLDLENRKLGAEGIVSLSGLERLSQVTILVLGDNGIGDEGVAALCDSPYLSQVKTLNLKSNNIFMRALFMLVAIMVVFINLAN